MLNETFLIEHGFKQLEAFETTIRPYAGLPERILHIKTNNAYMFDSDMELGLVVILENGCGVAIYGYLEYPEDTNNRDCEDLCGGESIVLHLIERIKDPMFCPGRVWEED